MRFVSAIKRTRHIIPTVDDIIVYLKGAKVCSKLDLRKGYNQLILSQVLETLRVSQLMLVYFVTNSFVLESILLLKYFKTH